MTSGIFLLLGSNKGHRAENLRMAADYIGRKVGRIDAASGTYQTAAWGKTDQPDFYNQVLAISTSLEPDDLLRQVLKAEKKMGRQRHEKWGPRIIDIDILFYGSRIIDSGDLVIPHPAIPARKFTLVPLNEIAPDLVHPVLNKKVSELLAECDDTLPVQPAIED